MLGYLAMVAEYGYIVALMESGRLLRQQFFRPNKFAVNGGRRRCHRPRWQCQTQTWFRSNLDDLSVLR